MNSNARIFFAALLGLLICLVLGRSALHSQAIVSQRIYASLALFILLCVLLGGIGLTWRMTHPPSFMPSPTPLPEQSQVIFQSWNEQNPSVFRSSLSGKDGTMHWNKPDQSPCTANRIFVVSDGIVYQKGALPHQQEVCIQATRLSDGTQLWSTTIKTSESAENLAMTSLPDDQLLAANGRLYFQINTIFFLLDASDGKVLHTIQPAISGDESSVIVDFEVNDQALVILYLVSGTVEYSTPYRVVTLQPTTGEVLWKSTPGIYHDLITLQGNTLYVYSRDKGIVALDVRNASQVWQADLPNRGILASSASAARLYVRAQNTPGSADASVYALDVHNGQVLWKVSVASWAGATLGTPDGVAPLEANGIVYVDDTNALSAYKATTGELLWRYQENPLPNDSIIFNPYNVIYFSQPVIFGDVLFVATIFTTSYPPPLRLVPSFCLGRCSTPLTGILALSAVSGKLYWHHEVPTSSRVALLTVSAS